MTKHYGPTLSSPAAEYDAQVVEVAATLDLGRDYDDSAELDEATVAEYREILDLAVAVTEETKGA